MSSPKTVVIQIGNSDHKLSQFEWSRFWYEMDCAIRDHEVKIHFSGFPAPMSQYQNACWVLEYDFDPDVLAESLAPIGKRFRQDSIAVTVGETRFV